MRIIVYKTFFGIEATNEENYNRGIKNEREIIKLHNFPDIKTAIEYLKKYGNGAELVEVNEK